MANGQYHVPWPAKTLSFGDQVFTVERGLVTLPLSIGAQVEGLRQVSDIEADRIRAAAPGPALAAAASSGGEKTAEALEAEKRKEEIARIAGINGDALISEIKAATSGDYLRTLRGLEVENPKRAGGRKGVLEAIDARLLELEPPPAQ